MEMTLWIKQKYIDQFNDHRLTITDLINLGTKEFSSITDSLIKIEILKYNEEAT